MSRFTFLSLFFFLLLSPFVSFSDNSTFEAAFPQKIKSEFLFTIDQLPKKFRGDSKDKILFNVTEKGIPWLLAGNQLITLADPADTGLRVIRIPGQEKIDRFSFMRGDALFVISGKHLGVVSRQGISLLMELPSEGMKISPGDRGQAFLYGGKSKNLFVFKKGRKLLNFLQTPKPINALSGDKDIVFLAIGKSIYLLSPGQPLSLIWHAEENVTSLALAPPSGLFFSTSKNIGYIRGKEKGFVFLREQGAELSVRGQDLYLFFHNQGVMKLSPYKLFDEMAKVIQE